MFGVATSHNRTKQITYGPATDGTCQQTTMSSSQSWTYDTADRTTTAGYTYDVSAAPSRSLP